jgi:hypothetical protein
MLEGRTVGASQGTSPFIPTWPRAADEQQRKSGSFRMTLAVAACFPWGRLKQANDSLPPGMRTKPGVILATDSRVLTGRFPSGRYQYVDDGRKLYPLDAAATLVFAGDVWSAQETARRLRQYRRRGRPLGRAGGPVMAVQQLLRRSYDLFVPTASAEQRPLHALLGVVSRGEAHVFRFKSPTFAPLWVNGVDAVGWPQDIETFKRVLFTSEEMRWKDQRLDVEPSHWQGDILAAMKSAFIAQNNSGTVGGLIQCVTITEQAMVSEPISWVVEGGDPMRAEDWEPLTVSFLRQRGRPHGTADLPPEAGLISVHVL